VTEKLHGANFSLVISAEEQVAFASSSGILAENDPFFGFRSQVLDASLAPKARALRAGLVEAGAAAADASVIVYGELCGGQYEHPDVPAVRGARPVQNGVWYSPGLIFVGFDVLVTGNGSRFLDFSQAREQALRAGLRFAEPLHTGSLASCVDFDFRFNSRLPALLGLPPLEKPNHAEGVVIRPQTEPTKAGRQLLKRKIPEFSEKQYRLDDWRINRQAGGGGGGCAADAESMLRFEMLACLTSQRVDAAVSKLGRVEPTDRARCRALLNELIADVHATLVEDGLLTAATGEVDDGASILAVRYPELQALLEKEARKLVTTWLRKALETGCSLGVAPL